MTFTAAGRPQQERIGLTVGLIGIVAGLSLLLFGGGAWSGIYLSDFRLALVVVGGVGSASWLVLALLRPRLLPSSALTRAFVVSLLAFAVSGALAWQPRLGFDYLAYAVLLTALYLMLVRIWGEPFFARRLDVLLLVLTLAIGVMYLVQVLSLWMAFWRQLGRLAVPPLRPDFAGLWLGNPNAVASLLVLLFLASAAVIGAATWRRRAAIVGLGGLVAVDVLLSGSRGSWAGIALAAVVGGILWLLSGSHRARLQAMAKDPRARAGILAFGALVALVGVVVAPTILGRLSEAGAAESRTSFWAASLRMFEERPLTGIGPGSWAPARILFSVPTDQATYVPHAHNVPLQVAAEFGLIGIVAAVVVVIVVLRLLLSGLGSQSGEVRAFGWATLLAVVYLSAQQLVDAYIHQPAILLALALPIARLDSLVGADAPPLTHGDLRRKRLLAAVLLIAVVLSTLAAASVEGPAQAQERAADAANAGDWATALSEAGTAAEADPALAPYRFLSGLAAAHLDDLDLAEAELTRATALDGFPSAWLDLAAVRLRLGDEPGARAALDEALRIGSSETSVLVAAAGLALDMGDPALARSALAAAFALAPSLASDPFWNSAAWRGIADQAGVKAQDWLGGSWLGFMLALERGDQSRITAFMSGPSHVRAEDARLAARAWGGDLVAFATLHERARSQSLDVNLVAMCRRAAQVLRDQEGAVASCDDAGWTSGYPLVRVGIPEPPQVIPGPVPYYHAPYAFRRVGPGDLLVPWVVRITSTIP